MGFSPRVSPGTPHSFSTSFSSTKQPYDEGARNLPFPPSLNNVNLVTASSHPYMGHHHPGGSPPPPLPPPPPYPFALSGGPSPSYYGVTLPAAPHGHAISLDDGTIKPGEMHTTVGLLPGVRPTFLDKYQPTASADEKQKRAQRENLTGLTEEEKQERRKDRARMYSHLARRKQEQNVRELIAVAEQLTVYRLMVEEASDYFLVISPDSEASILFANAPFTLGMQGKDGMPLHFLGRSLLDLVVPAYQERTRVALYTVSMDPTTKSCVECRLCNGVFVSMSLKRGTQGIVCIMREEDAEDESATAAKATVVMDDKEGGAEMRGARKV